MFVLAVATSNLARDMILEPNVGPLQQHNSKIITDNPSIENNQIQQKSQKSIRQLVVVPNAADGFSDDLVGYVKPDPYKNHPASFVSSKVPARRIPPYMNILIHEHHLLLTCTR